MLSASSAIWRRSWPTPGSREQASRNVSEAAGRLDNHADPLCEELHLALRCIEEFLGEDDDEDDDD